MLRHSFLFFYSVYRIFIQIFFQLIRRCRKLTESTRFHVSFRVHRVRFRRSYSRFLDTPAALISDQRIGICNHFIFRRADEARSVCQDLLFLCVPLWICRCRLGSRRSCFFETACLASLTFSPQALGSGDRHPTVFVLFYFWLFSISSSTRSTIRPVKLLPRTFSA